MSTSEVALFGDDSSSEEEQAIHSKPPKKRVFDEDEDDEELKDDDDDELETSSPRRTIELEEDDDDDDDDDEGEEEEEEGKKTKSDDVPDGNKLQDRKTADDPDKGEEIEKKVEYDPDAEDEEFDDDGGIVGSSARPGATQETAPTESTTKPAAKPKKSNNMTVMESTKPSKSVTMHMTKLPNLVGLQLEPFDVESYSPDLEEKDFRGYVHNVVRWRYKKDKNGSLVRNDEGKLERESNARLVKWEDGSMTLHVGSEVFSMDEIKSNQSNLKGYPGLNGYLYLSQKATFKSDDNDEEEPGGTVLECMGPIISRLTVRPSSLQSEAHKALTLAVRQRVIKRAKIAQYVTQEDPEKAKQERIRSKEDLEKEQARKNAARSYHRRAPGMNRRYLEEEEDDDHYDTFNVGAAKRRSRYADEEEMDYGDEDDSEEDEEDIGWTKGKLAQMKSRKKRQREEEKDEEEAFGVEEESEEEEQVARFNKPSSAGKKHRAALFDDDDDE